MSQPLALRPAGPAEVPGIDIVVLTPQFHEAARAAINEAFPDAWAMQPVGVHRWVQELGSLSCRAD